MKQLLMMIMLAAAIPGCSKPAQFRGSLHDLAPQQIGQFKLKGEIKAVPIASQNQYQTGALRPTEGVVAQYEASDGSLVSLQVLNYPSASDAEQSLTLVESNIKNFEKGAKVTNGSRAAGKQGGRTLVVERAAPGRNQVNWVNGSLFYEVSGNNLDEVERFEQAVF